MYIHSPYQLFLNIHVLQIWENPKKNNCGVRYQATELNIFAREFYEEGAIMTFINSFSTKNDRKQFANLK